MSTKKVQIFGLKGEKGDVGPQGPQGIQGPKGDSPQKGVDYFTEEDKKSLYIIAGHKEDTAPGIRVTAEGFNNSASGDNSHAEGSNNAVTGRNSHVEGERNTVSGVKSHGEGYQNTVTGSAAHAEGFNNSASGDNAHAEGAYNKAQGHRAHAEGYYTTVLGNNSHAEGLGTIAASENQHVQGKYNVEDAEGIYAHIVGGGLSDYDRKNIYDLDWSGNARFAGSMQIAGPLNGATNLSQWKGSSNEGVERKVTIAPNCMYFFSAKANGSLNLHMGDADITGKDAFILVTTTADTSGGFRYLAVHFSTPSITNLDSFMGRRVGYTNIANTPYAEDTSTEGTGTIAFYDERNY